MQVKQFTVNHFEENCYLVIDDDTQQCAIIDPGMTASYELDGVDSYLSEQKLKPTMVLLTHAHVDHLAGLQHVCDKYHLAVTMHADGKKLLRQASAMGSMMGFNVAPIENIEVKEISDGEILKLGNSEIECRFVPGHCEGSMAYVLHQNKMVITGDALFRGSIGRTDLPGGDFNDLIHSIKEKLLVLDDDYSVLPGHGDCSTIGDERNNPFIFE